MNVVVEAIPARMGGILTYTKEMSRTLPRLLGDAITLVSPPEAVPRDAAPGLRHVSCPPGGAIAGLVRGAPVVRRALEAAPDPVLFASANFSLQPRRIPQLLLMRNPIYFDPEYEEHVLRKVPARERVPIELRRGLCLNSGEVARYVITPTKAMRDLVVAARPALAGRVEAVPYGVSSERFRAASVARKPSPSGHLRVICHSFIAKHKPVWPILAGVAEARAKGADVTLTLVDTPFDAVHDPMPGVEDDRRLAQQGLEAGWLTITGRVPHERMPTLLAEHDAFAFHTMSESFGHPYVEAMASGLASVITDIPVGRELAGDGALYVPLFDGHAFAEKFVALAESPEMRADLGRRGQAQVAAAGLSWDRHFGRVAAILRALGRDEAIPPA